MLATSAEETFMWYVCDECDLPEDDRYDLFTHQTEFERYRAIGRLRPKNIFDGHKSATKARLSVTQSPALPSQANRIGNN